MVYVPVVGSQWTSDDVGELVTERTANEHPPSLQSALCVCVCACSRFKVHQEAQEGYFASREFFGTPNHPTLCTAPLPLPLADKFLLYNYFRKIHECMCVCVGGGGGGGHGTIRLISVPVSTSLRAELSGPF